MKPKCPEKTHTEQANSTQKVPTEVGNRTCCEARVLTTTPLWSSELLPLTNTAPKSEVMH